MPAKVHLETADGIIKESTEGAPKFGYFFLPLEEKVQEFNFCDGDAPQGTVVVRLEPPSGWTFGNNLSPLKRIDTTRTHEGRNTRGWHGQVQQRGGHQFQVCGLHAFWRCTPRGFFFNKPLHFVLSCSLSWSILLFDWQFLPYFNTCTGAFRRP